MHTQSSLIPYLVSAISLLSALPSFAQDCMPTEHLKLLASDATGGDYFGQSVSIQGTQAVVGAYRDDDHGSESGSAYIFELEDGAWVQTAKLVADDSNVGDWFGYSVSISNNVALIGSRNDNPLGGDSGSAYIFTKTGTSWIEHQQLIPSDGAADDNFGHTVAIDGDTAVIGAYQDDDNGIDSGSAYVFERVNDSWIQTAKLLSPDGNEDDLFGNSVSISGGIIIVSCGGDDENGQNTGAAYTFTKQDGLWSFQAKLQPNDPQPSDFFGNSVDISGHRAVMSAFGNDDNGNLSGSAYVFSFDGTNWTQDALILPSDGVTNDRFGSSVAIHDDVICVGARFARYDGIFQSGKAYLFKRTNSSWVQQAVLVSSDIDVEDRFGTDVSMSDGRVVVGAVWNSDHGLSSGSAYIFDQNCAILCLADLNTDTNLNFLDISAFLQLFSSQDTQADWNNDGSWNFLDISEYLQAFQAGCP